MPKYEIEIPDGVLPEGAVPVAYRKPNPGETGFNPNGFMEVYNTASSVNRLILRRDRIPIDWQPPSWLKDCWLATDYFSDGRRITYIYGRKPKIEHGVACGGGWTLCVRDSVGLVFSPWDATDFPFVERDQVIRVDGGKAFRVTDNGGAT